MEHYLVHLCRGWKDFVPQLDLVLEMDGCILGHIVYVQAAIHTDDGLHVMAFGPISIAPSYQHRSLGKALLEDSLARASATTMNRLMPPRLLLKELVPGYLFGVYSAYRTPEDYLVDETEALRFDVSFLPNQLV